jgi:type I restriction enzyme M protein
VDLRSTMNKHFTLRESNPKRSDLDDFVKCYFGLVDLKSVAGGAAKSAGSGDPAYNGAPRAGTQRATKGGTAGSASSPGGSRFHRKKTERSKSFTYDELIKRDRANLDIFWLKDESLEDSANLPAPDVLGEIVVDLEAALEQFATIAEDLGK